MNPQQTRDWDLLIPLASAGGIGWVVAAVVDRDYVEIFKDLVLILVQTFTGERRELCNACTSLGCVSISNSVTRSTAL